MVEKSHAFADYVPAHFTRDMGYSEKEFYRVLPSAIGDFQYLRSAQSTLIRHPEFSHQIELKVTPLPDRVLGAFRIPRVDVQFSFRNMNEARRRQFMYRFDRYFQKGGG